MTPPAATPLKPTLRSETEEAAPLFQIQTEKLYALVPRAQKERSTLGAYLHLVPNKRWMIPTVAVLITFRHAPAYLLPLMTGWLVTQLTHDKSVAIAWLPWVLAGALSLGLINIASTLPQRLLLAKQKRALTASLRRAVMRRIHRLTFAFHDRNQIGELQNKFIADMGKLEGLQTYLFETIMLQSVALLAMIAILAHKDWRLLALMLIAVPMNLMIYRLFWKPIRAQNEKLRKAESGFAAFLFEALSGVRVTRAHAVEAYTEERLGEAASAVAARGYRLDKLHAFFGSMAWASNQLLNISVLCTGVYFCAHGWIEVGDLLVIMAYFSMISQGIDSLFGGMPAIAAAHDAMNSLAELFERDDHEDNEGKPKVESVRGDVALREVSFRYPRSAGDSLSGMTLDIPAGTSVALVGASGSGKSTTAGIILGFYEPTAGQVMIDGRDLRQIDRRSVRRHVGVVSQDVVLFHDTILGNIAWGDPRPDPAKAEEAARKANAHDFIARLPDGYLHLLGDRGAGLSGGQRQRLAIARALYRDPKLLVLDEATSALDPESERVVQQALEVLMAGRTTLIIAHRLSTVRNADRIVVLDEGRVAESGTFAELMERRGRFHDLAKGQLF
jgi:ATP-binding cassette subfamily B protein